MEIREAKISDIDNNLLTLYVEGFNMHYQKRKDIFVNKSNEELRNNLTEMINNPDELIFVIDDDKEIIGYVALQFKNKVTKSIWIDEIVIDNNYRNKGYGKMLVDKVYAYAKKNKCKRVELNCWCFNSNAIDFYDKLGFSKQRIVYEKEIE